MPDLPVQSGIETAHGLAGLVVLAAAFVLFFHFIGFRVVVTAALRGGRA